MKWEKQGRVFVADGRSDWMHSHGMIPTPVLLNENILRVYTTFCDENTVGRVGYVDLDANDPSRVVKWSRTPVLDIGEPGQFDDNGALCCSVVSLPDGRVRMYYAGFELCHHIRYRLLTGMAESVDGGESFTRCQVTPVLERSPQDCFFRSGPFCIAEGSQYALWYVAGDSWVDVDGVQKPTYVLKRIDSADGVNWPGQGKMCFEIDYDREFGFGRPYIVENAKGFEMYYSIRDYEYGYRLGYALSDDGYNWQRRDSEMATIACGESGEWDAEMLCYAAVVAVNGQTYCFYNGNNYGETGFGFAKLISE
jgi:predicted GH43/DUF377 family glycosyl hydrolase